METSCPPGFQLNPTTSGQCIIKCPEEKGFVFKVVGGLPHCVHKDQPELSVQLNPQPVLRLEGRPMPPLEMIADPGSGPVFKIEWDRFQRELPVLEGKINKTNEVESAFKELQDAENVRDKSPDAYQSARIRYYTLIKGEEWAKEEAERVGKAEADPLVNQYKAVYKQTLGQLDKQQKTLDVVQGVKDKVLSLRDDLDYSVSTFGKQIGELRNQINMNRSQTKEDENFWINFLLNAMIVLVSLGVIYLLFNRLRSRMTYTGGAVRKGNAVSNLSRHR